MRLNNKTAAPRDTFVFEQDYDFVSRLPAPEELSVSKLSSYDIFICALGFEQRCVAIPTFLSQSNIAQIPIGLIGHYQTNAGDNAANEAKLSEAIGNFCAEKIFIDADTPELARDSLAELVTRLRRDNGESVRICFDISTCSGTFILSVIGALLETEIPIDLDILYCQAKHYFPTKSDVDADRHKMVSEGATLAVAASCYSEQGTQEPLVHPLYPGFQHEGRPDLAIAIPSFRMNRMVRCLDTISEQVIAAPDSNVHWIFGLPMPGHDDWKNQFQKEIVTSALNQLGSSAINGEVKFTQSNSSNCCVFDYRKTIKLMLKLADEHLGKNITCIPMGSKMQNLGVALALFVRNEISVTYARPSAFAPRSYSEGYGKMWKVSLGSISSLVKFLAMIGTLEATTHYGPIRAFSSSTAE